MEMKKIIAISVVTSAMLFGASATNLSTDQVNLGTGSDITNATVNQGTIDIADTSSITDSAHGGHGAEGANENTIDGTTVNGAANPNGAITIDQGRLTATNGSSATNANDHSENTIEDGTIDASVGSNVTVQQGNINIDASTYSRVEAHSTNVINDIDMDASGANTEVAQANIVVDGGSNLEDSSLTSTNTIQNGSILNSTVQQAQTEVKDGANVDNLTITQTNTIGAVATTADINGSTVLQGVIKADGAGTTIDDLTINTTNTIENIDIQNSTMIQEHLNAHSGSDITNVDITGTNDMQEINAKDSEFTQATINLENNSNLSNVNINYDNTMEELTVIGAHFEQDVMDLNNSTINGTTIDATNIIRDVESAGSHNAIHQNTIVMRDSTLNASSNINSTNTVEDVTLNDANITQNYVSIVGSGTINNMSLDNQNVVNGVDAGSGSDINSSSISQAEVILSNLTAQNGVLTQDTRNEVENTNVVDSTITQAKIAIANSSIDDIRIGSTAAIDNIIDVSDVENSTVTQNVLTVCNSTVDTLTVEQDNRITGPGSSVTDSTLNQGKINIGDNSCTFARAEHTHKF